MDKPTGDPSQPPEDDAAEEKKPRVRTKAGPPQALLLAAITSLSSCATALPAPPPPTGESRSDATVPAAPSSVVVRAQSRDEAFDYLWRQLAQMAFFREHGYQVGLPAHLLFRGLAERGLAGADEGEARRVFAAEVYDPRVFAAGVRAIEQVLGQLGPALSTFDRWAKGWGFERRAHYEVVLTLYGPGGSYDPDHATITVLTTPEGGFRKEPLHNLVHEMVHLGIERPIVRRFGLSHMEKERLVDRICVVAFAALLPGYRVQPLGPPALDSFVDAGALDDLPAAVAQYVAARDADPARASPPRSVR